MVNMEYAPGNAAHTPGVKPSRPGTEVWRFKWSAQM